METLSRGAWRRHWNGSRRRQRLVAYVRIHLRLRIVSTKRARSPYGSPERVFRSN
jgi:hypothetical protein